MLSGYPTYEDSLKVETARETCHWPTEQLFAFPTCIVQRLYNHYQWLIITSFIIRQGIDGPATCSRSRFNSGLTQQRWGNSAAGGKSNGAKHSRNLHLHWIYSLIIQTAWWLDAVRNKANGAWAIYALGPQGLSLDSRGCQLKGLRASFWRDWGSILLWSVLSLRRALRCLPLHQLWWARQWWGIALNWSLYLFVTRSQVQLPRERPNITWLIQVSDLHSLPSKPMGI